jgi:hypothetical protein
LHEIQIEFITNETTAHTKIWKSKEELFLARHTACEGMQVQLRSLTSAPDGSQQ